MAAQKTPFLPMSAISLFEEKRVRRVWNAGEQKWVFTIAGNTQIVAGTSCPRHFFKLLNHPHPAPRGFWESNPGAATKSPPRKISKLSPNPENASPAGNPDRLPSTRQHLHLHHQIS
jgi:hypothetical protein